jgi:endonuclease/exonuclease/phosphatase family metal-dependent hydrolase
MKIVQYNIYFGDHKGISITDRIKNLSKCLIEERADVVCLQEVLREKFDGLCELLEKNYPYSFPDRTIGLNHTYDTAIFSKHPIKKQIAHRYEFTTMGRNLKIALIENKEQEKSYYICTTHFESEFKKGCMKKMYQYQRCADILYQLYKKTTIPIIFCADTNICKISEHVFYNSFTHKRGWRDTWVENGSILTTSLTFDSMTNPILMSRYNTGDDTIMYRSRLDRIVHISDLHSTDFKLIGTDKDVIISDHYGVTSTISNDKPDGRGDYDTTKDKPSISTPDDFKSENMNMRSIKNKIRQQPYKRMF